jgi:tRNA(fMet)-specific endonuclease VapC
MEPKLILETTFLIDLEREKIRGAGPAVRFLKAHAGSPLYLTHTICGELAAGLSLADRARWDAFVRPFRLLPWTAEVDWQYGTAFRHLQKNGQLISSNDLWIAATAIANEMILVTANTAHFRRVPGLRLAGYR